MRTPLELNRQETSIENHGKMYGAIHLLQDYVIPLVNVRPTLLRQESKRKPQPTNRLEGHDFERNDLT